MARTRTFSRQTVLETKSARLLFLSPRALAAALRSGRQAVGDGAIDQLINPGGRLPGACLEATPIDVVVQAIRLLTGGEHLRVLDVGAGIGKLCVVGALTSESSFTGVERSLPLVRAARSVALRFGARGVRFVHGNVAHMELDAFDCVFRRDPGTDSGGIRALIPL